MSDYPAQLRAHYINQWKSDPVPCRHDRGPIHELPTGFHILEFPPGSQRSMWTYATSGMSLPHEEVPIELHLHSPLADSAHVELLTVVAHYHRTGTRLNLWHTVYFGRPWMPGSHCTYGFVSLPYLDGPPLESFTVSNPGGTVKCFWLIPITESERNLKNELGVEALESRFEATQFKYLDPIRRSVVD